MTWIDFKIDGIKLRIDSINWTLIQLWRDGYGKPDYWFECKINECAKGTFITVGGRTKYMENVVYKAHNPNWSDHYSRRNMIMFINGETDDYSIENLMIKPTKR
tara:strand:+ start:51 stop:362 length:312 start_codon:yes stop_codon:yes gene_type:complete